MQATQQTYYAGPGYVGTPPPAETTRARPWLNALFAGSTMLVLVAAIGNQWVSEKVLRSALSGGDGLGNDLKLGVEAYSWNVTRLGEDRGHFYLASLIAVIAAVVLTYLITAALTCGRGSFGHIFVGAWVAVIVASQLALYVRASIIDQQLVGGAGTSKADFVLFRQPNTVLLLTASIVYGLVVAIVTGLIGRLVIRREVFGGQAPTALPYDADRKVDPWGAPLPGPVAEPSPWSKDDNDADRTRTFDRPDTSASTEGEHTQAMPAYGSDRNNDSRNRDSDSSNQHTTQLPRHAVRQDDDL